jgi:threonine/homoserine/homoserine lactone efflux protein
MANLYPFLIYVFVTTFTPGPNNIMSMVNGMNYSYPKIIRFLEGIFAGFFIVMLLCGLLNVGLASFIPSSKHWLKILGAIYMVYLAIHIIRSGPIEKAEGNQGMNSFWFGFSMQFLNIKVILYGVTVFSLFIVDTYNAPAMIILFAILLAAIGFIATSCWAIGGNVFRNWAQKNYRIFNLLMGGLLIYTAVASLL